MINNSANGLGPKYTKLQLNVKLKCRCLQTDEQTNKQADE